MKKIVLLMMMVMSVGIMHAQWSVYPEFGMSTTKRVEGGSQKWESSIKAGLGIEFETGKFLSLKSGLYYAERGYILDPYMNIVPNLQTEKSLQTGEPIVEGKDFIQVSGGETKRHFFQIPVLANFFYRINDDIRLNLAVGPYVAYCFHDKSEYNMNTFLYRDGGYGGPNASYYWVNEGDLGFTGYHKGDKHGDYSPFTDINKFDWGATAIFGVEIKNWFMNLSYDLSLGEEYDGDNVAPKYNTLSFSAGYKFKW